MAGTIDAPATVLLNTPASQRPYVSQRVSTARSKMIECSVYGTAWRVARGRVYVLHDVARETKRKPRHMRLLLQGVQRAQLPSTLPRSS